MRVRSVTDYKRNRYVILCQRRFDVLRKSDRTLASCRTWMFAAFAWQNPLAPDEFVVRIAKPHAGRLLPFRLPLKSTKSKRVGRISNLCVDSATIAWQPREFPLLKKLKSHGLPPCASPQYALFGGKMHSFAV